MSSEKIEYESQLENYVPIQIARNLQDSSLELRYGNVGGAMQSLDFAWVLLPKEIQSFFPEKPSITIQEEVDKRIEKYKVAYRNDSKYASLSDWQKADAESQWRTDESARLIMEKMKEVVNRMSECGLWAKTKPPIKPTSDQSAKEQTPQGKLEPTLSRA
jgi:hypothetical protein